MEKMRRLARAALPILERAVRTLVLLLPAMLYSQQIKLNGKVINRTEEKDKLVYSYVYQDDKAEGTLAIRDGKFTVRTSGKYPATVSFCKELSEPEDCIKLMLVSPEDKILLDAAELKNSYVIDSKADEDYRNYNKEEASLEAQRAKLNNEAQKYSNAQADSVRISAIEKQLFANEEAVLALHISFARKYPQADWLLSTLSVFTNRDSGRKMLPEIESVLDTMKLYTTDNKPVVKLEKLISSIKNTAVGSKAPDFTAQDLNGEYLKLRNLSGKGYILLDFWASWCLPCREDAPALKQLYGKYHNKGLEIIGISTDQNKTAWQNAVAKDGTGIWKNVIDEDHIQSQYAVTAIPVKFLIDPNGTILARWKGGGTENLAELEKMLSQLYSLLGS